MKLECLRLLATLKLDRSRQALIRDFMDAYLRLSAAELRVYDTEVSAIEPAEREAVMQIVNEWEARGEARGEERATFNLVLTLVSHRFGEPTAELKDRVKALSPANLQLLAKALFDLQSMSDVEVWIATHH